MGTTLQLSLFAGLIFYFVIIILFLRKKTISLKYTLLWIISGIIMVILDIFPQITTSLAGLLGIATPSNAIFSIILFFVIVILMSITSIVSKMNEKAKNLAEYVALLEKRIRDLEGKQ